MWNVTRVALTVQPEVLGRGPGGQGVQAWDSLMTVSEPLRAGLLGLAPSHWSESHGCFFSQFHSVNPGSDRGTLLSLSALVALKAPEGPTVSPHSGPCFDLDVLDVRGASCLLMCFPPQAEGVRSESTARTLGVRLRKEMAGPPLSLLCLPASNWSWPRTGTFYLKWCLEFWILNCIGHFDYWSEKFFVTKSDWKLVITWE